MRILVLGLFVVLAYYSIGAYLLSTQLPRYLFPKIVLTAQTEELHQFKFYDGSNNQLLVREYGQSNRQCLLFFPGRHGGIKKYEKSIINAFQKHNFKVFSFSYPGQDGALGQVKTMAALLMLIGDAMSNILNTCSSERTIVYGRSLGAMVAMYAVNDNKVSGIILDSVAPSLSIAIDSYLNSRWYLKPLSILPITLLLPKNYQLNEPMLALKETPISVFQGDNDLQTPLQQLQQHWTYGDNVSLYIVKNGKHSDTYSQAINEILNVADKL